MRFDFCSTPTLERYLTDEERSRALVLLDVQPDAVEPDTFAFIIDCTFQALRFRNGTTRRVSYYAACEGGQIDFHVDAPAVLLEWSPPIEITAQYKVTTQHAQKATFAVKPSIELRRVDQSAAKASGPEVTYEAGTTTSRETTLTGAERMLNVIPSKRHVCWDLASLRVEKVVQNFFVGRIQLRALAQWKPLETPYERKGWLEVVPDRLEFYDEQRRPLGFVKSVLMWWKLRQVAQATKFRDGCRVDFVIRDSQ